MTKTNIDLRRVVILTFVVLAETIFLSVSCKTLAEVKPDNSLGLGNSSVVQTNVKGLPSEVINGGTTRGSALFQSLSLFNITAGHGGYFSNPVGITNIFVRITNGQTSIINGVIGVLGSANLFLLNPNGFIIGKDSSLDLNGSLTVSTADSVVFPEYEFSTAKTNSIPILKIDIPIGLRFTNNSGNIEVNNAGFSIYQPANSLDPATPLTQPPTGLHVPLGQNISFFGGAIAFNGAVVNLEDGNITVGGIKDGVIQFLSAGEISYNNVNSFGDITFDKHSFVSDTTINQGKIVLVGDNVSIIGGTDIILSNIGTSKNGGINILANNQVVVSGSPTDIVPDGFARVISGLISSALGLGIGGDITVNAKILTVDKTGIIFSNSYKLLSL